MKRYFLIGFLFFTLANAEAQMLEKVLKNHYASVGQTTLDGIRSMQMDVTEVDGFAKGGRYVVSKKRPFKIRKEGQMGKVSFITASDGKIAWKKDSIEINQKPYQLTIRERNLLLLESFFGSPLLSLSSLDSAKTKYMGIGYIGKMEYYLIRIEIGNDFVTDFFIDKRDWMIYKMQTYQDAQYKIQDVAYEFSNYQSLVGIKLPYRWSRTEDGNVIDVIIGEVLIDVGAANSDFVMPVD